MDVGPWTREVEGLDVQRLGGVDARAGGDIDVAVVAGVEQDAGEGQIARIGIVPHVGEHLVQIV